MSDLEQKLRDSAAWLIKLADDLRDGRAAEIERGDRYSVCHPLFAHYLDARVWREGDLPSYECSAETCVDLIQKWMVGVYVAECKKTGKRFVVTSFR